MNIKRCNKRFKLRMLIRTTGAIALLMLMLVVIGLSSAPGYVLAQSPSVFVGHWLATDEDGSDLGLTIAGRPSGPFQITLKDSYLSFCSGEAGIARGTGWPDTDDPYLLEAVLTVECFTTGASLDFHAAWIYDPGTDTLTSGVTTWHRPGRRGAKCLAPPPGLTGWWPGDGDASDIVSGRNGLLHGDAKTGSGLVDFAFTLDGDGDFVEVPDAAALNFGPGNFTVDLWVNFNDTSGEQVLVEKWIQGDGYVVGWTLTKLDNQVLRLAIDGGGGNEADLDSGELTILPSKWYHIAATRRGANVTLFMNGIPVAQNPDMGASNLNAASSIKFGHRGNPEDTPGSIDERGFYLNGRIDEVELFVGTALTEEQIMALFAAGSAGKCKDGVQPPPPLELRVNYGHDWVEGFYEAGHLVWITVTESDGVTVKATAELVTEPKDFWNGETGFQTQPENWNPAPPDIQPYDWVFGWVDNGASAQVQIGEINGAIDLEADSITGTVLADWFADPLEIECHPWGAPEPTEMKFTTAYPDGTDPYTCSWAGEWDIQPSQDIGVGYFGPDGHWVANAFSVPDWRIMAFPEADNVFGYGWPEGSEVQMDINGPVNFTMLATVGPSPWDENDILAYFDFNGLYDLVPGDVVTLSGSGLVETHTVRNLSVTDINTTDNTVSGVADDGEVPFVYLFEYPDQTINPAVESGQWIADFNSVGLDLVPGVCGRVDIWDEAGNSTTVDWCIQLPTFAAYMPGTIEGYDWPLGNMITLNINDGEYTAQAISEQRPDFPDGVTRVLFELWRDGFSMQAGDHILMTDEALNFTKELWVADLMVTDINVNTHTVSGIYDSERSFWVRLADQEPQDVQFAGNTWAATFTDMTPGTWGIVAQDDWDHDGTVWDFYIPNTRFTVWPEWNYLEGYEWPDGALVYISVAGKEVCATEAVSGYPEWDPSNTFFSVNFPEGCVIEAGDLITLSFDSLSLTHQVPELAITEVNLDLDTVAGTAVFDPSQYILHTWINDVDGSYMQLSAEGGTWLAEFGSQGFDLQPGMSGRVELVDQASNATAVDW